MSDPSPRLEAVLFDAGGVLLLPEPEITGPVLAPFGATAGTDDLIHAHFHAAHAMDHARQDGTEADWATYAAAYVQAAGVPPQQQADATRAFAAGFTHTWWVRPVPGATEALRALAASGVPLAVVSNAGGQVERDLARLGICVAQDAGASAPVGTPVVQVVIDSHLVGVAKPDPGIFDFALRALGLAASDRIGYVGDTVFFDVRSAAAAGLSPLLHDPLGLHRQLPVASAGRRLLPSLAQLPTLV